MATIALYANKVNRMPGLIQDVKKSVLNYKAELSALKNKSLKINQSICNTEDVISSIQASTQIQEDKIDSLEAFRQKNEAFVEDTVRIDSEVADVIRQRKDDFYEQYNYLKPECEKSWLKNTLEKAGEWCKEHWKLMVTVVVVLVAIACLFIPGLNAAIAGLVIGKMIFSVCAGILFGAISGGLIGGILSFATGGTFLDGFEDGAFSGAIAGGISGGMGFAMSGAGKHALTLLQTLEIGWVSGAVVSFIGDIGDKYIKGDDISLIDICANAFVSGIISTVFAGAGYGISKGLNYLFKNMSWFSESRELFRIGRTENPRYGRVTSYITGGKNGVGLNFAGNAGKTIIRFEFDVEHAFHIHIPPLWGTHVHFPLLPIINSSTSAAIADYTKSIIGGWTDEVIFESSY